MPIPTGTFTDRSGTIAAANVSQPLAPWNGSRQYFVFQNTSTQPLYLNYTSPASTTSAGSFAIQPGQFFTSDTQAISQEAINIAGGTVGQTWAAKEI